jgi:hypothetical protein
MLGSQQAMCQFGTVQHVSMKSRRVRISSCSSALGLALFGLVSLSASDAEACSCVQREDAELLASSDRVFAGEVERIEVDGHACESVTACGQHCPEDAACSAVASLRVLRGYKNTTEERVRVEANASTAACGYDFEIGQRYLVFASADEKGELSTTSCHGTGLSSLEAADRRMKPGPSSVPRSSPSSHCHCRVGARGAGGEVLLGWGAALAGLVAGVRRSSRRRPRAGVVRADPT